MKKNIPEKTIRKETVAHRSIAERTPSGRKKSFRRELSYSVINTRAEYYTILESVSGSDLALGALFSMHSASRLKSNAFARAKKRYETRKAIELLEAGGLVKKTRTDGDFALSITKEGRKSLDWARLKNLKLSRRKFFDRDHHR